MTDTPGDYAVVINVRGIESTYNSPKTMFITIEDDKSTLDYIFQYFESYIAFIIAFILIFSSSYGFPFYFTPISLILMGLFMFYVYRSIEEKGSQFVIVIFIVMGINIFVLLSDLFLRIFLRKKTNSPYFYQ